MRYLILLLLTTCLIISSNCFAESKLSREEMKELKIMQEKGIFPPELDPNEIDSKYIQFMKIMLKEEYGIEDISKIGQPDPRFSSPEKTWQVYKKALKKGDLSLAAKCHMPNSKHIDMFKKLGRETMKELALAMRKIERISGDDRRVSETMSQTKD